MSRVQPAVHPSDHQTQRRTESPSCRNSRPRHPSSSSSVRSTRCTPSCARRCPRAACAMSMRSCAVHFRRPSNPGASCGTSRTRRAHRARESQAREMTAWSASEVGRFFALDEVRKHRHRVAWWVAFTTGMRRGELLGLRWSDVDLDAGRVSIAQTCIAVDHKIVLRLGTKTGSTTYVTRTHLCCCGRACRSRSSLGALVTRPSRSRATCIST